VWDLSGNKLASFQGEIDSINEASLSPNGQQIVVTFSQDPARVLDLSGKQLERQSSKRG
jgi:WD40 repeat protein